MLSTPDGDSASPQHRHRHRCRRGGTTAPTRTIHRRRRTASHTLIHRAGFTARPTTLWPFADADPLPGTAQLAGWLGRVIVTLVTGYTRPGDRVLLLTPPAPARRRSTVGGARGPDPYAGLAEAVWTVIRLGRGIDATTSASDSDCPRTPTDIVRRYAVESASGLRLRHPDPHSTAVDRRKSDSRAACAEHRQGDRFDLIITVVHPHDTDWLAHTDWTTVLTPTGTIAAITHSDSSGRRLADPMPAIASTFRNQGWRWHDHIAVLTEHLRTSPNVPTATAPNAVLTSAPAATSTTEHLPIRAVHHDLMVFTAAPPEDLAQPATHGGGIG